MLSPKAGLLVCALLLGPPAATAQTPPARPALSASAVMAAASAVEADPLMGSHEKRKALRLKGKDDKREPETVGWWMNLIQSLSTGLRVVAWLVVGTAFILVLLRLRDWLQRRGRSPAAPPPAPTHIGSLDIRPESLPADIGAAARALLAQAQTRAALSLLYRGALSRLVHTHGVPIRAASTERECLALAARRLQPAQQAFLVQLVGAWQAVAYAHRALPAADLEPLCRGFDAALPAAPGGAA